MIRMHRPRGANSHTWLLLDVCQFESRYESSEKQCRYQCILSTNAPKINYETSSGSWHWRWQRPPTLRLASPTIIPPQPQKSLFKENHPGLCNGGIERWFELEFEVQQTEWPQFAQLGNVKWKRKKEKEAMQRNSSVSSSTVHLCNNNAEATLLTMLDFLDATKSFG